MDKQQITINYTNVHLCHDDRTILDNVCLQAQSGDMIYLTGQIGSGKSTLLSSMYGNTPIRKGHAIILGHDMQSVNQSTLQYLRRQIGIVHQDLRLLPDRTIYENLDFVLRATDWDNKSLRRERIEEVLNWIELPDVTKSYPHELSGGQKQCICVARAILNDPELILADEPTGQLDVESGERVMALLDEVRRQTDSTVVISTHNQLWPEIFPGTQYVCEKGELKKKIINQ